MALSLPKQNLDISFAKGLNTRTDPWRVAPGQFLMLRNTVFDVEGLLKKRNGFGNLPTLNDPTITTLSTHNGSLVALGANLQSLSGDTETWYNKGPIQSVDLSVTPLVRNATNQTVVDSVTADNGLTVVAYVDDTDGPLYRVVDAETGSVWVDSTAMPSGAKHMRTFILGRYFIITYLVNAAGGRLRYIAIPKVDPSNPGSPVDLIGGLSSDDAAYDGVVANNNLFLAFNSDDVGGALKILKIDSNLNDYSPEDIAGEEAFRISLAADTAGALPVVWVTWFDNVTGDTVKTTAYSSNLGQLLAPTTLDSSVDVLAITSVVYNGNLTAIYEIDNLYTYNSVPSRYLGSVTCTIGGVVGTPGVLLRSVGLGSKAFYLDDTGKSYVLSAFQSGLQPSFFLIDTDGNVISKLAYSNGRGYTISQVLPSVSILDTKISISYLIKTQLTTTNKADGSSGTTVYSQVGINLAQFDINNDELSTAEIGGSLYVAGGILWQYDGLKPVEQGFNLWPDDLDADTSTSGGSIAAGTYYYSATYEWTDGQGILHRSAPSVPFSITTTGATSTNTIYVPTLRVTYKTGSNPVRIVLYRSSIAQSTSYQVSSTLNDPTVDYVTFTDTAADASIVGNIILYTTGGVVENIGAPACRSIALYKSRLVLIPAEDPNNIWFSKQVIQSTGVEMSDLFVKYVAPTTGAEGSTGANKVVYPMDDKLLISKDSAFYYMTGNGPDNTGANDDFSEPTFITASVGSDNQNSMTMIPQGVMFQSSKGIWLLGRDLSTTYIGDEVQEFNNIRIVAAVSVPGTNQVRFSLESGAVLMYDYFYDQWGEFVGIPNISSVIYDGLHTFINQYGQVRQETPDSYLDGSQPVLISFKSGWFNLAGLQGLQRAYFFQLIGEYLSPHKLQIQIGFDYNPNPSQSVIISPDNYNPTYGNQPGPYGSGSYGGVVSLEQWRVFLERQKIQSFQIYLNEIYDASKGVPAGAGLTLSGINLVVAGKKSYTTLRASQSTG